MSPQLNCEISEIGISSYENDNVRPHLKRKLERVDRHHNINIRLVMALFSWRPIFGHDHEPVRTQPMDELVLLVPLLLPDRDCRRQSRINHHLDQLSSCVWSSQKLPELDPIKTASDRSHGTPNV